MSSLCRRGQEVFSGRKTLTAVISAVGDHSAELASTDKSDLHNTEATWACTSTPETYKHYFPNREGTFFECGAMVPDTTPRAGKGGGARLRTRPAPCHPTDTIVTDAVYLYVSIFHSSTVAKTLLEEVLLCCLLALCSVSYDCSERFYANSPLAHRLLHIEGCTAWEYAI
ncbi:hypothetical protein J6590_053132 [Homalodisca vitripennis]|nr:hypothetical protein J6590_053132 [Homalodisca vitripennis]